MTVRLWGTVEGGWENTHSFQVQYAKWVCDGDYVGLFWRSVKHMVYRKFPGCRWTELLSITTFSAWQEKGDGKWCHDRAKKENEEQKRSQQKSKSKAGRSSLVCFSASVEENPKSERRFPLLGSEWRANCITLHWKHLRMRPNASRFNALILMWHLCEHPQTNAMYVCGSCLSNVLLRSSYRPHESND